MTNPPTKNRRLPAEWEPQSMIMLTWPHKLTDWADILEEAESTFMHIAQAILKYQDLLVVCPNVDEAKRIRECIGNSYNTKLKLVCLPSNDTWARDHGPITVEENGTYLTLDFQFNAWGNKFPWQLDNALIESIAKVGGFGQTQVKQIDYVLEGGSIESDGAGTILTTSECLLNPNRNPQIDKTKATEYLKAELGAERILWLDHGYLAGDDTDSHIDTLARFCDEETICYVQCNDNTDEHFAALKAMEAQLKRFSRPNGKPYKLVPLPMCPPIFNGDERLPATYANFLIINGAVLVPTYQVEQDEEALTQIEHCFPDRDIIGIDCQTLIKQHGSLHCVTMQIPRGVTCD